MPAKKQKGLTDDEIGLIADRKVFVAVGVANSKLSKEREHIIGYYNGVYPKQQHKGQSSYVSSDVYDAVEQMKADLLETFGGSQDIGQFEPQGQGDVEACRIATDYCSYVIYRQNPGWRTLHDVIDDGLKARVGIVKVYWEDDKHVQDETFDGHQEEMINALVAQDDVQDLQAEQGDDGLFSGSLTRVKADRSQVKIEPVAPENFGVDAQAKKLDGTFHYQLELMTKDEMEIAGFDVSKLDDIAPDAGQNWDRSIETDRRFEDIDSGFRAEDEEDTDELKLYKVYECYIKLRRSKDERTRLYKVIRCAKQTLLLEEVTRSPFIVFCPLRVAHSFWGNNFAQRVVPTQNARTVLTRGILDHTAITLNPRYTVLQGGLTNPREMLDNRLGGLVNITRPDAVSALDQAPLNPFVYQTLEMLKANKEETTGTSSLSQGLNKDAISSQNSQGMVQDLVSLSKQRAKVVARNLAEFLADLYAEVYQLVVENEDRKIVAEVAGNWVDVDPQSWCEKRNFRISFHLGQAAADTEAMKFMQMLSMGSQDPELQRMIGENGKYNVAAQVMRLKGIKNVSDYITHPSQLPPPQPPVELQIKQAELQGKQQEMQAKSQQAAMKAQAETIKAQHEQLVAQMDSMNRRLEMALAQAEQQRKNLETASKIDIAQRELVLLENAPPEAEKAIVSPNP